MTYIFPSGGFYHADNFFALAASSLAMQSHRRLAILSVETGPPYGRTRENCVPVLPRFGPDCAMMRVDNHAGDRQTETAPRPVFTTGIGCVLFKNRMDMLSRNPGTRVADVNAIRVQGSVSESGPKIEPCFGSSHRHHIPSTGYADTSTDPFFGVNLHEFSKRLISTCSIFPESKRNGLARASHRSADAYLLLLRILRDFMDGLADRGFHIRFSNIELLLRLPPRAQFEHGIRQAGKPLHAMLHSAQEIKLIRAKRPYPLLDEESAVAVEGGERSAEIVQCARKEVGSGLIILLEFEIGMEHGFKKVVPVFMTGSAARVDALVRPASSGAVAMHAQQKAGERQLNWL